MKRQELSLQKSLKVVIQLLVCILPFAICSKEETQDILQSSVLQYPLPESPHSSVNNDHLFKRKELYLSEKVFQIEPSDAIDVTKYSQPAIGHLNDSNIKVPTLNFTEMTISSSVEHRSVPQAVIKNNISKPTKNLKLIESLSSGNKSLLPESLPAEEFRIKVVKKFDFPSDMGKELSPQKARHPNNFSDHEGNLDPESSDAVLSYQIPPHSKKETNAEKNLNVQVEKGSSQFSEEQNFSYSSSFITTTVLPPYDNGKIHDDHATVMNSSESTPAVQEKTNSSKASSERDYRLSSGSVAGIVIAVLVSVTLLSSTVIYLLYKKYNGKCTSVVESKFNTDNGGYLDDSLRSSIYLNNHIELPKESSEEMSSLDNDSFLNSLETMTIQNYWADNSKNTKV